MSGADCLFGLNVSGWIWLCLWVQIEEITYPVSRETAANIYNQPLPLLVFQAMSIHRQNHNPLLVQHCTLSNIKTGGCAEDCGYCSQSAHWKTGVESTRLLEIEDVLEQARRAKASGSTRFCMGAAWRRARDGAEFETVLKIIRQVNELGLESCMTLGMLRPEQARQLGEAGLKSYNHNLDTSPEFYGEVITTRTYQDRLETIRYVRDAGIEVCCGGILGMGESRADRIALLCELANLDPYPESVPINGLVPVAGTPMEGKPPVDPIEMVRAIATARILMPRSRVRLSAGRTQMSDEAQALCFLAGANSIFTGEKLLTTPNPGEDKDAELMAKLGLQQEDFHTAEKR